MFYLAIDQHAKQLAGSISEGNTVVGVIPGENFVGRAMGEPFSRTVIQ